MNDNGIRLSEDDMREGLRLEREAAAAHDRLHAAQNEIKLYVAHLGALYGVPNGWKLKDWLRGFEPATEGDAVTEGNHHG